MPLLSDYIAQQRRTRDQLVAPSWPLRLPGLDLSIAGVAFRLEAGTGSAFPTCEVIRLSGFVCRQEAFKLTSYLTLHGFRFTVLALQASNMGAKRSKVFSRKTDFEDTDEIKKIFVCAVTGSV
jgi:hypothetical protein